MPQVPAHGVLEFGVGPQGLFLLQGAADKGAQEHFVGWCTAGELDAAERAGDEVALFDRRYDEAHAVQGVGDVGAVTGQGDSGRRGIGDIAQPGGQFGGKAGQQAGGLRRGKRQADGVGFEVGAGLRGDDPAPPPLAPPSKWGGRGGHAGHCGRGFANARCRQAGGRRGRPPASACRAGTTRTGRSGRR